MFGFKKKEIIKSLDINEGYRRYLKHPEQITIICLDEIKDYDDLHIAYAQCFPFRLLDKFKETYSDQNMKYYFYAVNKVFSEKACRKLMKQGYDVYDLGSFMNYREKTEGLLSSRKNRRRKK